MDLANPREQTNLVVRCASCGCEQQVKSFSDPPVETKGCPFCGAGELAQSLYWEGPVSKTMYRRLRGIWRTGG